LRDLPSFPTRRSSDLNPVVRDKSIVELAPAGVSLSIVTSRPSAICQGDETPAVKIHRVPGKSAAVACEREIEKRTFRIAINCTKDRKSTRLNSSHVSI